MKTSAFASIRAVVPRFDYSTKLEDGVVKAKPTGVDLIMVGMAQNIRISDSFGTRPISVLGTPFPIITPGYITSNISIEKATVDGNSFRNLGAFNPLWAHVGGVYSAPISITDEGSSEVPAAGVAGTGGEILPFMFILAIKDKVSNSYDVGIEPFAGAPEGSTAKSPNVFGTYACVLSDANVSLSSQNHVIMDSVTAVARPLTGSWLSDAIRTALHGQGKNGMDDHVNSTMYGYRSGKK